MQSRKHFTGFLLILLFVSLFGISLHSANAGTKVNNGVTLTWPDDFESCEPGSGTVTASGIPGGYMARLEVFKGTSELLASSGDLTPNGDGEVQFVFDYPPTADWPVVDGQSQLLLSAVVTVFNGDNQYTKFAGKWTVTCPNEDPTPTPTPTKETPTPTPSPTPTEPPAGGEGCTPGYWRQPHHFDSWVGYSPDQTFDAVFGVTSVFGSDATLGEVARAKGGGENAMGRHAVAALLNAASDVSYFYTTDQVISMVQEAYATGNFELVKDQFEVQNELGCPLN